MPGYYKTRLDRHSTTVELTATKRTGMGKLTYPSSTSSRLLINTSRSATGDRSGSVTVNPHASSQYTSVHRTAGSSLCGPYTSTVPRSADAGGFRTAIECRRRHRYRPGMDEHY